MRKPLSLAVVWTSLFVYSAATVAIMLNAFQPKSEIWWDMLLVIGFLITAVVTLANVVAVIILREGRLMHMFLLLWVGIMLFVIGPFSGYLRRLQRDRWFFEHLAKDYEPALSFVSNHISAFSGQWCESSADGVGRAAFVRTNIDGTITVVFRDSVAASRTGYIYHSGRHLDAPPNDWIRDIRPLTNCWYEYSIGR